MEMKRRVCFLYNVMSNDFFAKEPYLGLVARGALSWRCKRVPYAKVFPAVAEPISITSLKLD